MAKQRHNIDHFFRQYLPDYEASKSIGNWDLLNHLLNEQERKRRNRKWLVIFLSIAIMLSGSWLAFILIQKEANTLIKSAITTLHDSSTSNEKQNKEVVKKENSETVEEQNNETVKEHKSVKENRESLLLSTESKQLIEPGTDKTYTKNNREQGKTPHQRDNRKNSLSNVHQARNEMFSNRLIQQYPINDTFTIADSLHNHNLISHAASLSDQENHNRSADSLHVQQKDSIHIQQKDSIETMNAEHQITITTPTFFDSTSFSADHSEPSPIKIDTQLQQSAEVFPIIPTEGVAKNFNINSGVNVYNTSESFTNNKNIAPFIGLEYSFLLAQRWSIGLGAWYSPQGGYSLNDTATQETYFFDHIVSQQAIHINRLHKLYFPLSIYYKLSDAHTIGIGIQPTYLLTTTGNYIEIHHTTTSNSRSEDNNVNGYMDGIKPVTVAMHVAYKYKLTKSLDLGLRFSQEITGAFERAYFYGINTNPSWGMQAIIHFNF